MQPNIGGQWTSDLAAVHSLLGGAHCRVPPIVEVHHYFDVCALDYVCELLGFVGVSRQRFLNEYVFTSLYGSRNIITRSKKYPGTSLRQPSVSMVLSVYIPMTVCRKGKVRVLSPPCAALTLLASLSEAHTPEVIQHNNREPGSMAGPV